MIAKRIESYQVYVRKDFEFLEKIFLDYLQHSLKIIKIFKNTKETQVFLVSSGGGEYILKVFIPQNKKIERFLKSFFKGDYYLNLFLETKRIREEGCLSINDFYFLAEKKFINYSKIFVMIMEYIKGEQINTLDAPLKQKIKETIEELHSHNMVMGDIWNSNFILSDDKIRIIDCSGKSPNFYRKAEDRINMENRLGIPNVKKDFGYFLVILRKSFREKLKIFKNIILFK